MKNSVILKVLTLLFVFAMPLSASGEEENQDVQKEFLDIMGEELKAFDTLNLFDQPIGYSTKMKRFTGIKYSARNASALTDINFNVSRASRNFDLNLPPPPRFSVAIPIVGIEPVTGQENIFAYVFTSTKLNMVVLSFTGTVTLGQLLSDLVVIPVPPTELNNTRPGVLVERGFYEIYLSVFEEIRALIPTLLTNKKTQFVISGHSLGGALTTLAAFDLADLCPIVYSFASPRVGNPIFAQTYNGIEILSNTWRVFNTEDIVPGLPLPEFPLGIVRPPVLIYEHVGNPVPFTLNKGTFLTNHIDAYEDVIINCLPPTNPNGICPKRHDCSEKKCENAHKNCQ